MLLNDEVAALVVLSALLAIMLLRTADLSLNQLLKSTLAAPFERAP